MINSIKLIYFKGCPEAQTAIKALSKAGIHEVEEILQDNLPVDSKYRKYTSPSILLNEELIYGLETRNSKPACSFDLLNFFDEKNFIYKIKTYI